MAEQDLPPARGQIGLDFATLRAQGLGALQDLCGAVWTDYNLHDPGVTVLEALVYGLTDLAYRTEFDVADYLTGSDGAIAYEQLALYGPEQVFHGQALTVNDYRRLLYDAIPEVGEIWVRPLGNGRLSIDIAGAAGMATPERRAELARCVRRHYAANRNLCEDLGQVTVLEPVRYYLGGDIDTCGERAPADMLAQVIFDCGNYMSSGMAVHRLRDVIAQGMPPEAVYEGPVMHHGYVTAGEPPAQVCNITISELVGVIQQIEGVSRVRRLVFRDSAGTEHEQVSCDTRTGEYPCLPFPTGAARGYLRLQPLHSAEFGSVDFPSDPLALRLKNDAIHIDAEHELKKLLFYRHAFRTEAQDGAAYPMPVGQYRELADYYSVQNDLPAMYGVGQYGLPHSAGNQRKAEAQQLKGYLFPFEQLMANYLQNLQQLPTLFSAHDVGQASYFSQHLANQAIPNIEELLIDPAGEDFAALREQDDYSERKGRLYDYLLALHGESFPQAALRRFNHYHAADTERWLLGAKAELVRALVSLSAWRGTGANYLSAAPSGDSVSFLERRIGILLGMPARDRIHGARAPSPASQGTLPELPTVLPQSGWQAVPPDLGKDNDTLARHEQALPAHALAAPIFRAGIALSNYAMAIGGDGASVDLYCGSGATWSKLGHYPGRHAAIYAAYGFVRAFSRANQQAECLHVVEHILLWPSGLMPLEKDFLASRMSVVLPDWTARCGDSDFRRFVQETVRRHAPAHVHPVFLWLPAGPMAKFEELQHAWREALRALHRDEITAPAQDAFNQAAWALMVFLREQVGDVR